MTLTEIETMLFKHRGDLAAIEDEYGVRAWQVLAWIDESPQLQEAWYIATKGAEIMDPAVAVARNYPGEWDEY